MCAVCGVTPWHVRPFWTIFTIIYLLSNKPWPCDTLPWKCEAVFFQFYNCVSLWHPSVEMSVLQETFPGYKMCACNVLPSPLTCAAVFSLLVRLSLRPHETCPGSKICACLHANAKSVIISDYILFGISETTDNIYSLRLLQTTSVTFYYCPPSMCELISHHKEARECK